MMVPDMHIEALYYGIIIAAALLPVQWLLEMIFKMSSRLVSADVIIGKVICLRYI